MTRYLVLLLALVSFVWDLAPALAQPRPMAAARNPVAPTKQGIETPVYTGRMIVKLERPATGALIQQVSRILAVQVIGPIRKSPYLLVRPLRGKGFVALRQVDLPIEYIEPEVRMLLLPLVDRKGLEPAEHKPLSKALDARDVPTDPYFRHQWGMQDGLFGVGLPTLRALTKGAGIIVAILDTGVRQDASDLAQTKFMAGLNVAANNQATADDNGHGTHVAGTIAQSTNNGIGCAGLVPAATILPVKVLDKTGRGSNYSIGVGIRYAVDKGARVLNLSIGGVDSQTLKDAVEYAQSKGALICAASGNSGKRGITYPAAYPSTVSVGATTATGARASFSQYGPGLTLVAPGSQILQQTWGQGAQKFGFFYFSGTSMATPMVSGACAAILALNPNLSGSQVRGLLTGTARDLGAPGYDEQFGAGLLNAAAACQRALSGAPPSAPQQPTPPVPGPTPVPTPVPPVPPEPAGVEQETLKLFNGERAKAGLAPVSLEARLTTAAQLHAADMRKRGVMSHTGGDGSSAGTRIRRAGYPGSRIAEIIAAGQRTPAEVLNSWMHSAGHKAIILDGRLKECGIAKDGSYWCATWGAR